MEFYDYIGIIGVVLVLISYMMLHLEKMKSSSLSYSVSNLVGSILILYSLYYDFNLSAVIIEIFWMLISIFGICKYFYLTKRKKLIS